MEHCKTIAKDGTIPVGGMAKRNGKITVDEYKI
jgi:hypothetical protein